jgi:hypothetical protein
MFNLRYSRGDEPSRAKSRKQQPNRADLDSIVEFKPEGCVTVAAFATIAMREREFRVTLANAWHCQQHRSKTV